ncbi:hypothetical protein E6C27_scaffold19G003110 [Cucumis melo var. makuwa]|uniref:Uncharacterized protein n=1 Tax=Cucumis melo var. makuwa TaxID=1194695 RepID=A0A5A7SMD7_CUCMM|nr:hypothetical protein E6C27_scaffold19G003110 [Cucumis melo var. makuwa]
MSDRFYQGGGSDNKARPSPTRSWIADGGVTSPNDEGVRSVLPVSDHSYQGGGSDDKSPIVSSKSWIDDGRITYTNDEENKVLVPLFASKRVTKRGDSVVSDPTSIRGWSGFCHQIHHTGRSDRAPLSFGDMTPPSTIQLLLGDDRAFSIRSTSLAEAIGHLRHLERSNQVPSSFGEVTPLSARKLPTSKVDYRRLKLL